MMIVTVSAQQRMIQVIIFYCYCTSGVELGESEKRDGAGRIPLHYAALKNNIAEIERLISCGADVSARDKADYTPLHFAAKRNHADAARILVRNGAEVNRQNEHGNTPLHVAVAHCQGEREFIMLLREYGADPYVENNYGVTPVAAARSIGNFDIAQYFADLD